MAGFAGGGSATVEFMSSGILMYGIIASACSSPQTAEINANKRADTLMKWVHLGLGQGAVFMLLAASIADHPGAVLAGGSLAAGLMYWSYVHARQAGLASGACGTET